MFRNLFNFRFRLNAAIFLVSIGATVTGLAYYYKIASSQIWGQMTNRVKDFGKIGIALLSPEDLKYLETLDKEINSPARSPVPVAGTPLSSLADAEKMAILRSNRFQFIVQKLRRIRRASGKKPVHETTLAAEAGFEQDIHRAWIAGVKMHDHAPGYLRVLCADEFEEIDRNNNRRIDPEESIYHIGDVFNGRGQTGITAALSGDAAVGSGYRTENSGVYISGFTPIKNARGQIIALLVIDFSAATEFDALFNLKITGYYIIVAALLFSILAASVTSRLLLKPLEKMQQAAIRIGQRDFSVRIENRTNDELADLAYALNLMAQELGEYSQHMEKRIETRTREISGILESLEQGILTVDEAGIIQNEYSRVTLSIFGLGEIAHRKFSGLFDDEKLAQAVDSYLRIFFSNNSITPQMLEKANPLREIRFLNHHNETRHLRFNFRPLEEGTGNLPRRLLVSIVDDTYEMSLKEKIHLAEEAKRSEFDVIINLMRIPPRVLTDFLAQQKNFLQSGKSLITNFETADDRAILAFAQEAHALKGNALQLGFTDLARRIHELEASLQMRLTGENRDVRYLRHQISRHINAAENLILDRDQLVERIHALAGMTPVDDPQWDTRQLRDFWLNQIGQKSASSGVPARGIIEIADGTDETVHQLHNVLVQLVRNTFAHGAEDAAGRLAAGKPRELTIGIRTRKTPASFELVYEEDGRGFPGLAAGKTIPLRDLVQKGLTALPESATLEAGRGLGMEYIAARIEGLGGTATATAMDGSTVIRFAIPR